MTSDDIYDLSSHPDAADLLDHDHPRSHLLRWRAYLTAKAWVGARLGCFFSGLEGQGDWVVLLFDESNHYRPRFDGQDMRRAPLGALYEIDAFVGSHHLPIIDRVELLS